MSTTYQYVEEGNQYSSFWRNAIKATQPKPYTQPLPYVTSGGRWLGIAYNYYPGIRNYMPLANGYYQDGNGSVAKASNKALNKLYERMEQSEALLVAWKERQSALDLIATNVGRLVRIARAVKRRDPKIVRKVLKRNPTAKDIVKSPSGLWLEYHFAIVPTIMDIHHACGLLGYEFPVEQLSASSGAVSESHSGWGTYQWYRDDCFDTKVKLTGEIYSLNPNITLATQLGFGQPLSVAWEMTPFSWFVDYFVNVGDMVKNLQPRFPGIQTRYNTTTVLIKGYGKLGYRNTELEHEIKYDIYESFFMRRSIGWPSFQLEFSSPFDLKGQQCSYIVAVLGSILTSMKPKS